MFACGPHCHNDIRQAVGFFHFLHILCIPSRRQCLLFCMKRKCRRSGNWISRHNTNLCGCQLLLTLLIITTATQTSTEDLFYFSLPMSHFSIFFLSNQEPLVCYKSESIWKGNACLQAFHVDYLKFLSRWIGIYCETNQLEYCPFPSNKCIFWVRFLAGTNPTLSAILQAYVPNVLSNFPPCCADQLTTLHITPDHICVTWGSAYHLGDISCAMDIGITLFQF